MVESSSGRASDHENSSHRAGAEDSLSIFLFWNDCVHDIVEERKHLMYTGGLTDEEVQSSGRDLSYQSHRSQGERLGPPWRKAHGSNLLALERHAPFKTQVVTQYDSEVSQI
ncbi:hypothetical protein YC2023_024395 [Brassica napus]